MSRDGYKTSASYKRKKEIRRADLEDVTPERCNHTGQGVSTFETEYYGWRCRLCGVLYPYGCAPWEEAEEEEEDDYGL